MHVSAASMLSLWCWLCCCQPACVLSAGVNSDNLVQNDNAPILSSEEQQDGLDLLVLHLAQTAAEPQLSTCHNSDGPVLQGHEQSQDRSTRRNPPNPAWPGNTSQDAVLYRWLNECLCYLWSNSTFQQSVLVVLILKTLTADIHTQVNAA